MTHPVESKKIYNATYRHQMAQAILIGILTHQRLVSPPPPALPATNRPVVKNRRSLGRAEPRGRFQNARRENGITNFQTLRAFRFGVPPSVGRVHVFALAA